MLHVCMYVCCMDAARGRREHREAVYTSIPGTWYQVCNKLQRNIRKASAISVFEVSSGFRWSWLELREYFIQW